MKHSLALPAWVVGFSLLGVGGLARDVGHPAGAAILSTLLVWAAPAQVILYGGLAAGAALPAIAAAVCLSSVRFLPMVMSILPLLKQPQRGLGVRLLATHLVAVTVWLENLRRLPALPPEERLDYYLGFAVTTIAVASAMTLFGYYLAGVLPAALLPLLLFINPVYFAISLSAGARTLPAWCAVGLGFCLAPVLTALIGREFDVLTAGVVGGTAAYGLDRLRRARRG
jgi:predicted branched-subunit amino acid permease